jgi:hypothetical protein
VISVGAVLPFGHACALVTTTRRNTDPTKGAVGQLYNYQCLIIGQPLVSFAGRSNPTQLLRFPFAEVELTQTNFPCKIGPSGGSGPGWVFEPGSTARMAVAALGTDRRERTIRFNTPLYFVPAPSAISPTQVVNDPSLAAAIAEWNRVYGKGTNDPIVLDGQRVAYAESDKDDTTYETQSFGVMLEAPKAGVSNAQTVVPVAHTLNLAIEAIRHLTPQRPAASANVICDYDTNLFQNVGLDTSQNPHQILFTITSPPPKLSFGDDTSRSGGFLSPDMTFSAISKAAGPVAGALTAGSPLLTGGFDPGDFFGEVPKLFGFLSLKDIVQTVAHDANDLASKYIPKCVTQELASAERFVQEIAALHALLQSAQKTVAQLSTQAGFDYSTAYNLVQQGISATGAPLTLAEKIALTKAYTVAQNAQKELTAFVTNVTTLEGQAQAVWGDVTNGAWDKLLAADGASGDLIGLLNAVKSLADQFGQSSASAYLTGLKKDIEKALQTVEGYVRAVDGAVQTAVQVIAQLKSDLAMLKQGLELAKGLTVELTWKPKLKGLVVGPVAFLPATEQGLSLDIKVRAKASGGAPAGADVTCRLDLFAIGFGDVAFA